MAAENLQGGFGLFEQGIVAASSIMCGGQPCSLAPRHTQLRLERVGRVGRPWLRGLAAHGGCRKRKAQTAELRKDMQAEQTSSHRRSSDASCWSHMGCALTGAGGLGSHAGCSRSVKPCLRMVKISGPAAPPYLSRMGGIVGVEPVGYEPPSDCDLVDYGDATRASCRPRRHRAPAAPRPRRPRRGRLIPGTVIGPGVPEAGRAARSEILTGCATEGLVALCNHAECGRSVRFACAHGYDDDDRRYR
jgi:hypothetical protein